MSLLLSSPPPAGADACIDACALGRYMRAWWSVAGGAVGAALPLRAYAKNANVGATADV
jgi:hypothetical protein